jgi:hypothetical protein
MVAGFTEVIEREKILVAAQEYEQLKSIFDTNYDPT